MVQMDVRRLTRRRLLRRLAGAAAWIGGLAGRPARAEADPAGEIVKLRGTARLLRQDRSQAVRSGMRLVIGDTLLTGPDSRLRLKLIDGSVVTLGENARLVLDRAAYAPASGDRTVSLSLFDGILRSSVAKVKGQSIFEVKSALVTSAARSTEWVLELKGPAASLLVLEGRVAAAATPETAADLPDAPIARGVELEAGWGLLVGPPTRMLGVPLADLGRPIKWPAAKVQKLERATEF